MSRLRPCIEPLESRLLLDGNVAVSVIAGNLVITGDSLNNDIIVQATNQDQFKVKTGADATTINALAGPLTFSGVTGNVQIALNDGSDRAVVETSQNARDISISGGPGNNTISFAAFIGNPENVTITNGAGNDAVTLSSFNKLGNVFIDNGAGTNITTISAGTTLSGNVTVMGGSDADTVTVDSIVTWNGGLTVLSSAGASNVEITNTTMTGGISVFASGGGTFSNGPYAGYASVFRVANACDVGGAINVYNGPGPNTVGLNGSTLHGSVFLMNGPGAAYAGLTNTHLTGTFTFLRGDGGALVAPLAAYASQVNMDHSTLTGGITILNGSGVDESDFLSDTLGGAIFISNGAGPSRMGLDGTNVAGGVTLMTTGGGVLPSTLALATLTTFSNACDIGGDLNLFLGAGTDEQDFSGLTVHGSVLISNGPDAAAAIGTNNHFQRSFTWMRGDGGSLSGAFTNFSRDFEIAGSTFGSVTIINGSGNDGTAFGGGTLGGLFVSNSAGASMLALYGSTVNGSVTHLATGGGLIDSPPYADYATATVFASGSHVTGDITALGGAGNDNLDIENTNVDGSILFLAGPDGALLKTDSELIKGRLTFIRGDGGGLADVPGYSSYAQMTSTLLKGDATFINGAGDDGLSMSSVGVAGNVLVLDGADAGSVNLTDTTGIDGSLSIFRGDGGSLSSVPGTAGYYAFTNSSPIKGPVFIMSGAGRDLVNFGAPTLNSAVTIMNGTGDQVVGAAGTTFNASLSIYGTGGVAQILLGDAASPLTTLAGSLTVFTGDSSDTVTFRNFFAGGATNINTAGGNDTLAIDDSVFNGTVDITTGPAYIAGVQDFDIVNIELVAGTPANTAFNQLLRITCGADTDEIWIGSKGVANAHVHFVKGFNLDGNGGVTNTLDYLANANVFDAGAVQIQANLWPPA